MAPIIMTPQGMTGQYDPKRLRCCTIPLSDLTLFLSCGHPTFTTGLPLNTILIGYRLVPGVDGIECFFWHDDFEPIESELLKSLADKEDTCVRISLEMIVVRRASKPVMSDN